MFKFERGSFFGGQLNYSIVDLHFSMNAYNGLHYMKCFEFDITEEEMSEIEKIVKPAQEWMKKYNNDSFLDGYGWNIEYCHNDVQMHAQGYMDYPDDFWIVVSGLQDYMECLCKKYCSDIYIEEEAERRRSL